jgi:pimeloyl-ACP methyl ester carboxylesterase
VYLLGLVVFGSACMGQLRNRSAEEELRPCSNDPSTLCGSLSVYENRSSGTGRTIPINVVVIPAIDRTSNGVPVFFLDGGPGVSATKNSGFFADSSNPYRKNHDVVLIDVRGTGASNPLHCRQLQFMASISDQLSEMYPVGAVRECYDSLSGFADLTRYNTVAMAMDMEEIRVWLGYEKIGLFALSFGTRLAQVYMKMFPKSVESCVLWSPTTTNSRMPLYHAKFADESLARLLEDCRRDSLCNLAYPDLEAEFNVLLMNGKAKPFEYREGSLDGDTDRLLIPWHAFHTKLRSLMYSPYGLRQIPYLIHQSYLGNWKAFIALYPDTATYDDFIAEGLYLCVTCTEDVPFIADREADSLTHDTFMGMYRIDRQRKACENWERGVIPADFFEPLVSGIPTLILSGYFDPVTPPSLAATIAGTLSHGYHITIPAMSHVFDGLSNVECFDRMVLDFFDNPGAAPESECVNLMVPPAFRTAD